MITWSSPLTAARFDMPLARRYGISLPQSRMTDGYNLVHSAVSRNALGVVLKTRHVADLPKQERIDAWKVCIGPLVTEVAAGAEYPAADYETVIKQLVTFLTAEGAHPRGLKRSRE